MAVGRDGANSAHNCGKRNRLQEAKPDEGRSAKPAEAEVGIGGGDLLVKPGHALMELPAHPAYQPVPETRELTQGHCWTRFDFAVGLPERQENDSPLSHGR